MIRLLALSLAASLSVSVPANAAEENVTVAQFLELWRAIDGASVQKELEETGTVDQAQHPEFARAIALTRATGFAYRARLKAERAAGQTPHSCLPDNEVNLDSDTIIPHLRSYPPEQRATLSLADAFADLMAKTYPCP